MAAPVPPRSTVTFSYLGPAGTFNVEALAQVEAAIRQTWP